ncbi:MAG: ATP-binding protein [Salinisphaera sp.]|jgi:two-component system sensor histidine kinase GlrK|nr:ATP-binding protein [Salinisphaera sp.]
MPEHVVEHSEPASSSSATRRWLRPRSITGLLVVSFGLVAAPLIVAVLASVVYVDTLNNQSERLVKQGVEVTRSSKRLNSLLLSMERSARQYRVLRTGELLARFQSQAKAFDDELDTLAMLKLDTVPDWNLNRLSRQVTGLSRQLGEDKQATDKVIAALGTVGKQTDRIAAQGSRFVDKELGHLQGTAASARIFVLLSLFALVPAVLILGVFLSWVIGRPLRQILQAVTRLGDADFSQQIRIVAPAAELDRLGARLDWMRRRLATLDKEKQQFIRDMSHELKTPLASIREGAELLRDGTVGQLDPAQAEVADILQRNSLELAGLIESLLDFSAWQQRRGKLEYKRFDISALIEAIVARQKLTIEGKNLRVERPGLILAVTADRDRMHLIVDNLLANAVKFAPTSSRVRITVTSRHDGVDLSVADQGPGVAADERDAIFDVFFRGSRRAVDAIGVKGSGIGLSVVRECVQAHSGHIRVESGAEGGAVFKVHIPSPHAL